MLWQLPEAFLRVKRAPEGVFVGLRVLGASFDSAQMPLC